MDVFAETSYKKILRERLLQRKKLFRTYSFKQMADHCRVQKTFISRIFNGDAHLNDDQLILAMDYLSFQEDESEYITHLHKKERAYTREGKHYHQLKLTKLLAKRKKLDNRVKATSLDKNASQEDLAEYYLNPKMLLLHNFLALEEFRLSPSWDRLDQILGVDIEELRQMIQTLEKLKLIELKDSPLQGAMEVRVLEHALHLPQGSILKTAFVRLMRLLMIEKNAQDFKNEGVYFSGIFSVDEPTFQDIKEEYFKFLNTIQKKVRDSSPQGVYQIVIDMAPWYQKSK